MTKNAWNDRLYFDYKEELLKVITTGAILIQNALEKD